MFIPMWLVIVSVCFAAWLWLRTRATSQALAALLVSHANMTRAVQGLVFAHQDCSAHQGLIEKMEPRSMIGSGMSGEIKESLDVFMRGTLGS